MTDRFKLLEWYFSQGCSASRRKIEFQLSFDEWLDIWIKSGKLALRGARKGCFVMARHNDEGPYRIDNVSIVSHVENARTLWWVKGDLIKAKIGAAHTGRAPPNKGKPMPQAWRDAIGKANKGNKRPDAVEQALRMATGNRGKTLSAEHKRKISLLHKGSRHSAETRAKMSASARARWMLQKVSRGASGLALGLDQ